MKYAFAEDQLSEARGDIYDAAAELFGGLDGPNALKLARRIAGLAPLLLIGIEERQKIVTFPLTEPHTEND